MPFPESIAKTFTSARFTEAARKLEPSLPAGRVNIRFMTIGKRYDGQMREVLDPVYSAYAGNFESSLLGHYYQNVLTDFLVEGDLKDRDDILKKLQEFGWKRDDDGVIKHSDMWDCATWAGALEATLDFAIAHDHAA